MDDASSLTTLDPVGEKGFIRGHLLLAIYRLFPYRKTKQEDLTPDQRKLLRFQ